jgi:hypothetical protein
MLIDKIIERIENEENRLKEIGCRDPYAPGISFLYDLSLEVDQRFRIKIILLEDKINDLILIVRRLRKAITLPIQERSMETKNMHYIKIDIESFFGFSYSILEIIARLTPIFYKPPLKGLKSGHFREQRKWFIEHPEKDSEYSEYLKRETSWFEDFVEHRKKLTHYHPLIIFQSTTHGITFGTDRNRKGFIPNFSVLEYINETTSKFLEFIIFYNEHYRYNKNQCAED